MKKYSSTIFLVVIFAFGAGLMLYPSASNYINSLHATRAVRSYASSVEMMDDTKYQQYMEDAQQYNADLLSRGTSFLPLKGELLDRYNQCLNFPESDVMAYIEIPSVDIMIPIYHGTSEDVLSVAIGHLEWSSLPIGGTGTHAVLSGHRGLPSARLFTDIDQLVVGDEFLIHIMGDTLTYEVDQIRVVLPQDMNSLVISEGEDLCTLVTCTPYGVNSHRLLVRGHRIDPVNSTQIRVSADALQIRPALVAPFVATPILLILLVLLFTAPTKQDDSDDYDDNDKGGIFRAEMS